MFIASDLRKRIICAYSKLFLLLSDSYFLYIIDLLMSLQRYLAPEILEDNFPVNHFEAYKTADMYSMGLIIWEIMWRCGNQGKAAYLYS